MFHLLACVFFFLNCSVFVLVGHRMKMVSWDFVVLETTPRCAVLSHADADGFTFVLVCSLVRGRVLSASG